MSEAYNRAKQQACKGLDFQTIKVDAELAFPDMSADDLGKALVSAWRATRTERYARQLAADQRAADEARAVK